MRSSVDDDGRKDGEDGDGGEDEVEWGRRRENGDDGRRKREEEGNVPIGLCGGAGGWLPGAMIYSMKSLRQPGAKK